ncbi:MAG: helix-turn-helix transcriptional regulator [bacterium]|nr:helix-turn-helix transcriptional regulator [bacterium]
MGKHEFRKIRKKMNKTQKEMAGLLGVSKKAVESYEQGLRNIPPNVERIVYYLLFKLNMDKLGDVTFCWDKKDCPTDIREHCIGWIAKEGVFCWFITGKVCIGEKARADDKTIENCFQCSFFKENLEKVLS